MSKGFAFIHGTNALMQPDLEQNLSVISAQKPEVIHRIVHQHKRTSKSRCCQAAVTLFLLLLVSLGAFFGAAEIISKPGYDRDSQDTKSMQTLSRIQSTRHAMPALAAKLRSGKESLFKQEVVDYIQLATAFSAASYTIGDAPQNCVFPVKANLTRSLRAKSAQGYVARDDDAQLLVVAFRGITGFSNILEALDTRFVQLDVATTNATDTDWRVQNGVQNMYRRLENDMLRTLEHELETASNYTILLTGHNIGGSIAVMAGLALRSRFPDHLVLIVTQGQAKTFNEAAVQHIESVFPPEQYSLIRATHSTDGIPNAHSPFVNKHAVHHGGEVWHFKDAALPENVIVCQGRTDTNCSASYTAASFQISPPSLPWSAESLHYFDVEMNSKKSIQCGGPGGLGAYKLLTSRRPLARLPGAELIARHVRA